MAKDRDNDESGELNERGQSYLVLQLAEKIIDNANTVSSGIRLLSDNVESLTSAQVRLEVKFDEEKKKRDEFIDKLSKSGIFEFLESWSKKRKLLKTLTVSLLGSFLFLLIITAIKMSFGLYGFISHVVKRGGP